MDKELNLLYEIKEIKSFLKDIEKRLENIEDEILDKSIVLAVDNEDLVWNNAKEIIKRELTEVSFNTWISPITQLEIEGNIIFLQTCNEFSKSILESRYMELLNKTIYQVMGSAPDIKLVIEEENRRCI